MNATPTIPFADVIPAELAEDTKAVIAKLTAGVPLDPETYRRIRQRADRIRDEIFQKHGLSDIGVPLIRELRDSA